MTYNLKKGYQSKLYTIIQKSQSLQKDSVVIISQQLY